jgi:hypothetical protein
MPEHDGAVDGAGRRRDPAGGDTRLEQLVGGRSVIPHGDRVHAAESCRVEDEEALRLLDDHVVCEFILDDNVDDVAAGRATPPEHVLERPETIEAATHTY